MNQYKRPALTLEQLAEVIPTVADNEELVLHNAEKAGIRKTSYATLDSDRKAELNFEAEVAYDPRLINSGVVYGD